MVEGLRAEKISFLQHPKNQGIAFRLASKTRIVSKNKNKEIYIYIYIYTYIYICVCVCVCVCILQYCAKVFEG